jgi:phosphatidylglycerophosphate synthase
MYGGRPSRPRSAGRRGGKGARACKEGGAFLAFSGMRRRTSLALLNTLSLTRLPMAAAFVLVEDVRVRVALVVGAALTDFLDGWIARHKHLATRWGALIDPIGDRGFMVVALVTLLVEGRLEPWAFGLLLLRDVATALGFLVAQLVPQFRPVEFKARLLGKVVTTLQLAALLALLVAPELVASLVLATGLTALLSVVDYMQAVWKARVRPRSS